MKGNKFVFDSVDLLYNKLHKISLNRGGSYIDSPKQLKNKKKTAINPRNNDGKSFEGTVTVALNHGNIVKDLQRISKVKPFINQYNWEKKQTFHHIK